MIKRVLIVGKNSYIGESLREWLEKIKKNKQSINYVIDELDVKNNDWMSYDFKMYNVVVHLAGIAHVDTGYVSSEKKSLYYSINTELVKEVAKRAKQAGVNQFIFMSSMSVYNGGKEKKISPLTIPCPTNIYGNSKLLAEKELIKMSDDEFKVAIIRSPMVYGSNCKGNFPKLVKLVSKIRFFPALNNRRSMIYIFNLCEFIKLIMDYEDEGYFFPQNREIVSISSLIKKISSKQGGKIWIIPGTSFVLRMFKFLPGKVRNNISKMSDEFVYQESMSIYKENYQVYSLDESLDFLEKNNG